MFTFASLISFLHSIFLIKDNNSSKKGKKNQISLFSSILLPLTSASYIIVGYFNVILKQHRIIFEIKHKLKISQRCLFILTTVNKTTSFVKSYVKSWYWYFKHILFLFMSIYVCLVYSYFSWLTNTGCILSRFSGK